MHYETLNILRCPVTKQPLRFELISESAKEYGGQSIVEIFEGVLYSPAGFIFPIIGGIPRMLVEAVYDYADFLRNNVKGYENIVQQLEQQFGGLLKHCATKNKKTKKSFEYEWNILQAGKNDKIWHSAQDELPGVFLSETGGTAEYYIHKTVIDVGSGHGIMTGKIATMATLAIGVELSKAVENAYKINTCKNAWFIQGDLQFLPFENAAFDVLYSSGVIHHTASTERSFLLIEPVLKPGGRLCLWLYHPQKSILHNFMVFGRAITSRLPLRVTSFLLAVFVLPFTFLLKKMRKKTGLNYREEFIDLLDMFTPEHRHEIMHDVAKAWLLRGGYENITITTQNQFGFSVAADK